MIIDEKGRLLGLVNIVDLVVIILVLALALGAYYRVAPAARQEPVELQEVEIQLLITEVMSFSVDSFLQGDHVYCSSEEFLLGEITSKEVQPLKHTVISQEERLLVKEEVTPQRYNLVLTLNTRAEVREEGSIIKEGEPLLVGDIMTIETRRSKARATIYSLNTL